jgi:transposase
VPSDLPLTWFEIMNRLDEIPDRRLRVHELADAGLHGVWLMVNRARLLSRGRMTIMPKKYPSEFRDDVVRVARKGDSTKVQIAKDFGISEACLYRWIEAAELAESGVEPESVKLRELSRRNRVLEQENEILRRAAAFFARESLPK